MPPCVSHPPDLASQNCWEGQYLYGEKPAGVSSADNISWPFYPGTIVPYPGPSTYPFDPEPYTDSAVDTPSLDGSFDGSSHETPWDYPSSDETTLNTPTSAFSCNLNVQDTDNLQILLSDGSQKQPPYLDELTNAAPPRSFPHRLLKRKDYRKRQRDDESHAIYIDDMLSPEKMSRTTGPDVQRPKDEQSSDIEADVPMDCADGNGIGTPNGEDTDGDEAADSAPYAQLIYRALKSAPNHAMVLKDIYEWFEKNTDKAKIAPSSSVKGWQNSIRHNLSMNGAFNKVEQIPPTDDGKRGYIWVLADSALQDGGVKSTTRYRKHNSNKKAPRSNHPAPQRQLSGAKGGKAAKKSAANASKMAASRLRRSVRPGNLPSPLLRPGQAMSPLPDVDDFANIQQQQHLPYRVDNGPYYHHTPTSTPKMSDSEPRAFDYGEIVGCAPDMDGPLFYDEPAISPNGPMLSNRPFMGWMSPF